jgi:hypothetical protein
MYKKAHIPWVLHNAQFLPHDSCDLDDTSSFEGFVEEEYYGNYSFICVENGKKKVKKSKLTEAFDILQLEEYLGED